MIRDIILFGLTSTIIREKLIQEGDKLTLDKAIEIARTFEYAQSQNKSLENIEKDVSAFQRRRMRKLQQGSQNFAYLSKQQKDLHKKPDLHKKTCGQCGNRHMDSSCPAKVSSAGSAGKGTISRAYAGRRNVHHTRRTMSMLSTVTTATAVTKTAST
ncbi:hypothetical protein DPMN_004248 [Dreissena polymorpha]|uniref:Gag protein n=1 Tax=Dreissena polymorpha TaxID=45954 RepID=A0A9D4RVG6_DREPO|nr:hypothetical protein DPMN_004248 [Dreissena polymorpha]